MTEITNFEYIILKKLIYDGVFFRKVMPILKKKYFTNIGNQKIFELIFNYYEKYKSIPNVTELVAMVKNVSNSEIRSEIVKSLQKINKTEDIENVDFICEETVSWVKDALYMEALRIGSDGLMRKDDRLKQKAQQILEEMAKVTIDRTLGLDFDDIDQMIEYYSTRNIGIKTQHKELNKRLGAGFLPGTLSIILAASGIGKSLMMTDLISGIFRNNKNILLVSLEMADKEIMKRVHANVMNLPINSFLDLSKTEGELQNLNRPIVTKQTILDAYNRVKTEGKLGKLFIKDYPAGSFSALMLEQLVDSYRIEKGIKFDIIFIDYIGIMKSDIVSPSSGLYSYVKSIAEEVRAVSKKLNVPIVSASQLNRAATNNIDKADNSNVSDSMGTVMTADFMLFLLQNEEMKNRREIVCKVTKNRFSGRTDTWIMGVDYEYMRFYDLPIQGSTDINNIDIENNRANEKITDDFGIITPEKQQNAENFAINEIREIAKEDMKKVIEHDKKYSNSNKNKDPFDDGLDEIYKELGL